jgi:glutamyl/glutaminyl-tRNA synthetase
LEQLKRDQRNELQKLRNEMTKAAEEYSNQIKSLESLNRDQVDSLNARHVKVLQVNSSAATFITAVLPERPEIFMTYSHLMFSVLQPAKATLIVRLVWIFGEILIF